MMEWDLGRLWPLEKEKYERERSKLEEKQEFKKLKEKIIKSFEKEKNKLDLEINKVDNILEDLSGLNNDQLNYIINEVILMLNKSINNKKQELELKEKIIKILNKSLSKSPHIIDLPIQEFINKYK